MSNKALEVVLFYSRFKKTTLFLLKKEFFYKNDWLFGLFML